MIRGSILTCLKLAALLAALLCFGACAGPAKNYVVLLDNPQKPNSAVIVSNKAGKVVLDHPGEAVGVADATDAPGKPYQSDPAQLDKVFGAALAARPEPPVAFILYFKTNSTDLTDESKRHLPEILALFKQRKVPEVSVVGHTDSTGTADYNDQLALKRAQTVRDLIASEGVDPALIQVSSHGQHNPLVIAPRGVPEPRNRRVEVTVR